MRGGCAGRGSSLLLEHLLKEGSLLLHHVSTGLAADAVAFLRVDDGLVGLAGLLEGIHHLEGVGEEHVVVLDVVQEQEAALEIGGGVDGGAVFVAFGVLEGGAEVALGVNGVVVAPIGDGEMCIRDRPG